MKKLQRECPTDYRYITITDFLEKDDFNQECYFQMPFGFDLAEKKAVTTIWHQKTFNKLKLDLNLNTNVKKTLMLFHFYANTSYVNIRRDLKNSKLHLVGLFLILIELEKFFENSIRPLLLSESNKIFEKRYYLDIKRRIFNIFYYFDCFPETLNFYLNSLVLFIIKKHKKLKLRVTPQEISVIITDLNQRKKQLILEYNQQFHYMVAKNGKRYYSSEFPPDICNEFSLDYLEKLRTKNKYKHKTLYLITTHLLHRSLLQKKLLVSRLVNKLTKNKEKKQKERNFFADYPHWF